MVSKEWEETVREVNNMRAALNKNFDIYTVNAIERLIVAHIKLDRLNGNNTMKEAPIEDAVTNSPVLPRRTAVSGAVVKMANTSGKASTLDENKETKGDKQ